MAELTHRTVDIRRANGSVYFWLARGWIDDIASVRGVDDIIPQASGRDVQPRRKDVLRLELQGQIKAATEADFLALVLEMSAVWDPTLDPGPLVAADGYRGLAIGETATRNARTINVVPGSRQIGTHRLYTWELECVDSPPEWVIA